jgi:catechol 2,3-dioxygenase-like lactoylglutathione lyase family enzyme
MPDLSLVILATPDLPRLKAFYTQLTAWKAVVDEDVYVELSGDGAGLGLYAEASFYRNLEAAEARDPCVPEVTRRVELYFRVDDPQAYLEAAVRLGARELSPVTTRVWGDRVGYVADPDGNVCALASRPATS